jgi:metal-sulfur cluster biosynthetic enzyme
MSEPSGVTREPVSVDFDRIRSALRQVRDAELGLSIIDLGLVYAITLDGGEVQVQMTLTSPGCPAGGEIIDDARAALQSLAGVTHAEVELVWEPPWSPDRIDPRVRAFMGY